MKTVNFSLHWNTLRDALSLEDPRALVLPTLERASHKAFWIFTVMGWGIQGDCIRSGYRSPAKLPGFWGLES